MEERKNVTENRGKNGVFREKKGQQKNFSTGMRRAKPFGWLTKADQYSARKPRGEWERLMPCQCIHRYINPKLGKIGVEKWRRKKRTSSAIPGEKKRAGASRGMNHLAKEAGDLLSSKKIRSPSVPVSLGKFRRRE